jgi:pimeloyl-[acyl-carrier protein] synthase
MTLTAQTDVDLTGAAVIADPYAVYRSLRELGPVVDVHGTAHVTTYDLADSVLKNPVFGRGEYGRLMERALGPGPLYDSFSRWILYLDPPRHTRLRSLIMRAFTPRAVARLRDTVQSIVDRLLDDLDGRDEVDLIDRFAYPLPVQVICALLGVPVADRDEFKTWSSDVGRGLQITTATPEIIVRGNAAAEGLTDYFRDLIAERRISPQDGFLDDLIGAEDDAGALTDDELLATLVLLFFAGHETTVNLLGNGTLALLESAGQWAALLDDLSTARPVVEEMLRFDTPVQRASRVALADTEIAGRLVRAGELIIVLIAGANRDPARFGDPDRFDVGRPDAGHLAFASGPHYCVGATLARAEAEIAVASLARRYPRLALAGPDVRYRSNVVLRGLEELVVRTR